MRNPFSPVIQFKSVKNNEILKKEKKRLICQNRGLLEVFYLALHKFLKGKFKNPANVGTWLL